MAPESKEKLQYVYRLQQSKLVSIGHLTENPVISGAVWKASAMSKENWPANWRVVPTGVG